MLMHDIWNPWHGCIKCSPGCENCYMYYLDATHGEDGSRIFKSTTNFKYPLKKDKNKNYKIKSGEYIRICMTSDFFLAEADEWRNDVWDIIRQRKDVIFFILTKRAHRIKDHLPYDWGEGWDNVIINVTAENQEKADERIPILLDLKAKHKGVMCAPFIGAIDIRKYLETGQLEQVICGGENYANARPCNYDWVLSLHDQCKDNDVSFCWIETGSIFIKDGKRYNLPDKKVQAEMSYKSMLNFKGKEYKYNLYDEYGYDLRDDELYKPMYNSNQCKYCGSRQICNGCSGCGKCSSVKLVTKEYMDNFDDEYKKKKR